MANLLPPAALKKVKREYWLRVISVWFGLIGTALLMVAILQIPVYVLVKSQSHAFSRWYEKVGSDKDTMQNLADTIKHSNNLGRLLSTGKEDSFFSQVLKEVDLVAGDKIVVNGLSLDREGGKVKTLSIIGIADSRTDLANFKSALEDSLIFTSVTLPLANLAKDVDVPFNITVTVSELNVERI